MNSWNGPKLELKLNLSPPRAARRVESPSRSPATSQTSSCLSSELNQDESLRYCESPEVTSMMLAGCPRCLMYVMLAEEDPADLSLLNVTQTSPNIHQDGTEELVLNSSVHCHEPERGKFDEGHVINGSSQTIEKNEHHGKTIFTETRAREILEVEENVAELQASNAKVTQIAADIIVETFPLSGSTIAYGLDEKSSDQGERTDTWVERELEKVEARNNQSLLDSKMMGFIGNSSDFGNDKAESNNGGLSLEKTFVLVDEKAVGADLGAQMLENSNDSTTKEGTIHNTNDDIKPEAKDASTAAIKALDAKDGIHASTPDGTVTSSSPEQSSSVEAIVSESKPDIQHGGNSLRESNPTLDRMNLESWNVESERSVEPETNPLMAFFRSFISAFVKFWSE